MSHDISVAQKNKVTGIACGAVIDYKCYSSAPISFSEVPENTYFIMHID